MMEHESSEMDRRERQRGQPARDGYSPLELPGQDLARMVAERGYLFNGTSLNEDLLAYSVHDIKGDMSIGFLVRSELGELSVWMRTEDMDKFRRMFSPPMENDQAE